MKISIGMKLQSGPWGGGNRFGVSLVKFLKEQGLEVVHDLNDADIDIIILTEPRMKLKISAFTDREIWHYLHRKNPQTLVIHRINECDERKNTEGVNKWIGHANLCADYTIYVSSWLRNIYKKNIDERRIAKVILNGSDPELFFNNQLDQDVNNPLKIVTHHWGANYLKGFDIYERLDELVGNRKYQNKISFTYIGNVPKEVSFKNTQVVSPLNGEELRQTLQEKDVYLTASVNEPGSHHQNEGALCGLPLLYRNNASMPEYCSGYGIAYNEANFEEKLSEMISKRSEYVDKLSTYPHTSLNMCRAYHETIQELHKNKFKYLKKRRESTFLKWLWEEKIAKRELAARFRR
jgi:hypothetical protein